VDAERFGLNGYFARIAALSPFKSHRMNLMVAMNVYVEA
jgi:hypothetical protein